MLLACLLTLAAGDPCCLLARLLTRTSGDPCFFFACVLTLTMADLSTRDSIFEHEAHWTTIKEAQYSGTNPDGWSAKDAAAAK